MGNVTQHLAHYGGTVYAFEPNPNLYQALQERFSDNNNVVCFPKAVHVYNGTTRFYFDHGYGNASSLRSDSPLVQQEKHLDVPVIDLCEFIESLHSRIKVLKLDVEGVEVPIIMKLIDTGLIHKIDYVFAELHDFLMPALEEECEMLRSRVETLHLSQVNLDWE